MSGQLLLGTNPVQIVSSKGTSGGSLVTISDGGSANYNFRYLRFYILKNVSGSCFQFSMLQFYSDDNSIFQYPQQMVASQNFNCCGSETFDKTLDCRQPKVTDGRLFAIGGKICSSYTSGSPSKDVYCDIDLGDGNSINLRYFNNIRWFASNDTYHKNGGYNIYTKMGYRNITSYLLQARRENEDKWYDASSGSDITPIVNPSQYEETAGSKGYTEDLPPNYGLVHTGKIRIDFSQEI